MVTALALLALLGQGVPTEAEARKAEARLAEKPDDPAANLVIGKYLAWSKSDWEGAAPFIEKSSDVILKRAFEADAAGGKTGPEMIGVGDEWVAAGDKRTELKKPCRERATYWYAKAWPLVEGVWKDKLRAQLKKLASPPAGSDKSTKSAGVVAGWGFHSAFLDGSFAHSGARSVRLIASRDEKTQKGYSSFGCRASPVSPGDKVKVSGWVFTDGTEADSHFDVRFFDSNGKFLGQRGPYIPPDSPWWQKISGEVEAPPEAFRVNLQVSMTSCRGAVWVDEVSLSINGKELVQNGDFEK